MPASLMPKLAPPASRKVPRSVTATATSAHPARLDACRRRLLVASRALAPFCVVASPALMSRDAAIDDERPRCPRPAWDPARTPNARSSTIREPDTGPDRDRLSRGRATRPLDGIRQPPPTAPSLLRWACDVTGSCIPPAPGPPARGIASPEPARAWHRGPPPTTQTAGTSEGPHWDAAAAEGRSLRGPPRSGEPANVKPRAGR